MDVVLVDRGRAPAHALRAALLPGDRLRLARESALASGAWWPPEPRTRAILLGGDGFDATTLRALHRLWIAEHGPPAFLLTRLGAPDEAMLAALAGKPPHAAAHCAWRPVHAFSLVHLIALERLLAA